MNESINFQSLLGIIAIQTGILKTDQLLSVLIQTLSDPDKSLDILLESECGLTGGKIEALKEMAHAHIASCSGDETIALDLLCRKLLDSENEGTRKTMIVSDFLQDHTVSVEYHKDKDVYFTHLAPETEHESDFRPLNDASNLTTEHKDRYITMGEIGRGGIGKVFLAFDKHLGREIAVKELLPHLLSKSLPESKRETQHSNHTTITAIRFLQEARITGQMEHPGIIPVYELGQRDDGTIYYSMKLIRGTTLTQKLKKAENLAQRLELLPHYLDLCQTLAYSHSRGVIHRDIKPDNVMIGEFGETVVLDWGLAKIKGIHEESSPASPSQAPGTKNLDSSNVTIAGTTMGTPAFMPPEQAMGDIANVDERSDVWSLGVVLYKMLSGLLPFPGNSIPEVIGKVIHDPLPHIKAHCAEAPAELIAVTEKCLSKNSAHRYSNAGELASEIQSYLSGGKLRVFTYSPYLMMRRWIRRHKAVTLTIAFGLILLSALGVWSHIRITEERDQALTAQRFAEQKEEETRTSLSQALTEKGMFAARDARWAEAKIYYSGALMYKNRLDAQLWLNMESFHPYKLLEVKNLGNHKGFCIALGISPDEETAISGGFDGSLKLWDLKKENFIKDLSPLDGWVSAIEYSQNRKFIGCASSNGSLRVVNALDHETIWHKETGNHIRALSFTPDSRYLLTGEGDGQVRIFETNSGGLVRSFKAHKNRTTSIDFTSDGDIFATVSESFTAKLWDFKTGKEIIQLPNTSGWISAVVFSPDNSMIAIGSSNNFVQVYDVNTFEELFRLAGHDGEIFSLRFTRDGEYLISSGFDMTIRIWNIRRRTLVMTLTGHRAGVFKAIPYNNGNYILSVSNDSFVKRWKLDRKNHTELKFQEKGLIEFVEYTSDGKYIVGASNEGNIHRYNLETGVMQSMKAQEQRIDTFALSPDNRTIATAGQDSSLLVWDLHELKQKNKLNLLNRSIQSIDFAPDSSKIALAYNDGEVALWDMKSEVPVKIGSLFSNYCHVKFIDDGKKLIGIGTGENSFSLWDVEKGDKLLTRNLYNSIPYSIAITPNQKHFAVSLDNQTILIFESDTQKLLHTIYDHDGEIAFILFSPDGKFLATACWDKYVRLFDTKTWEKLLTIPADNRPVRSRLSFSPDSQELAWGTYYGSVRQFIFKKEFTSAKPASFLGKSEKAAGYKLVRSKLVPRERLKAESQ